MPGLDLTPKPSPPAEQRQIVTFRVGGEEYALDIGVIAEVIRPLKITVLPRMPKFVSGVVNLRGTIIPVVDLRKRFAVAPAPGDERKTRMLITRGAWKDRTSRGRGLLALVVDAVYEVLALSAERIEPAPDAATGGQTDFISGMGKLDDRLVILVDLTRILSRDEREALAEARDAGA